MVEVVTACAAAEVAVVPQGGNTGLVGGSVPGTDLPVILSTRRLQEPSTLDPVAGQIDVGAGWTLAGIQAQVEGSGWEVGVDLGARDTATIGGMIATNAGGSRVLRDGMMRRQVAGVEVVLSTGEVLASTRALPKDNTGYDLVGLMCGSEGTLGIITRAILQLVAARPHRVTAMVAVESLGACVDLVARLRRQLPSLEAAEFFSGACLDLVCSSTGRTSPFSEAHPGYILVECADVVDPLESLAAALGSQSDVVVGADRPTRDQLWAYRDSITPAIGTQGIPHKFDVTVPLGAMADFEADLTDDLARLAPDARLYLFGHIADGGCHVNVITSSEPGSLDRPILELVVRHGGSVSAEHGIGRAKVFALGMSRSPVELAAMRRIKDALDPAGLLNPGVLLPRE